MGWVTTDQDTGKSILIMYSEYGTSLKHTCRVFVIALIRSWTVVYFSTFMHGGAH